VNKEKSFQFVQEKIANIFRRKQPNSFGRQTHFCPNLRVEIIAREWRYLGLVFGNEGDDLLEGEITILNGLGFRRCIQ
jgi:hypothetical protein